jgi:DNA-binding CsgD family transcriptional regulator
MRALDATKKKPGPPTRKSAGRRERLIYISMCSGGPLTKISAAVPGNFVLGQLAIKGAPRLRSGTGNVPSQTVADLIMKDSIDRLGCHFRLSTAEAKLALHLVGGQTLRSAAVELGISYETTRTSVKKIFEKTQTSRQAELVILIFTALAGCLEAARPRVAEHEKLTGSRELPRFVIRRQKKGRIYYYFRRQPFPLIRLPGEPDSPLFTTAYKAALQASTPEEFSALRAGMQTQTQRPDGPLTEAVMAWAERQPITRAQAMLIAERFGVSVEHITRDREILD